MKAIVSTFALIGLFILANACNRDATRSDENVQREEEIRSDDIRENDNFERSVPLKEDEMEKDREDLDMGTNDTSVTD